MIAKRHLLICYIAGILFPAINTHAQNPLKQEIEERIRLEEMPEEAANLLADWLQDSKKIRFYHETDGDQQTYEAKLTYLGRRFSLEFNTKGVLLDIEELINFRELPSTAKESITTTLVQSYDKYKIRRVQRQFLPQSTGKALLNTLQSPSPPSEQKENYELEVDVKEGSRMRSYEILFNTEGKMEQRRLIVRRSLDNFLY